jgi:hypothetical protein
VSTPSNYPYLPSRNLHRPTKSQRLQKERKRHQQWLLTSMHLTLAFGPEFSRHFFIHVNDLIMLLSMFIAIISSTELSEIQRKKLLLPVIELTN